MYCPVTVNVSFGKLQTEPVREQSPCGSFVVNKLFAFPRPLEFTPNSVAESVSDVLRCLALSFHRHAKPWLSKLFVKNKLATDPAVSLSSNCAGESLSYKGLCSKLGTNNAMHSMYKHTCVTNTKSQMRRWKISLILPDYCSVHCFNS